MPKNMSPMSAMPTKYLNRVFLRQPEPHRARQRRAHTRTHVCIHHRRRLSPYQLMAGRSVASVPEFFRQSGHLTAASSSTAPSICPLSIASAASAAALPGPEALAGATTLLVRSRAESQTFWSEKAGAENEDEGVGSPPRLPALDELAVDADEDDSGELRSKPWNASCAAASPEPAGRLPPHCSHALLMLRPV